MKEYQQLGTSAGLKIRDIKKAAKQEDTHIYYYRYDNKNNWEHSTN